MPVKEGFSSGAFRGKVLSILPGGPWPMTRVPKNTLVASGIGAATILYLYEAFQLPFGAARMPDMGFVPVLGGFSVLGLCALMIGRWLRW